MTPAVPFRSWAAVAGSTLGAFMAILNIQVTNASLADIRGAIGGGLDEGSWITTAYLIAEIVAMPLAGWLSSVFSIRRYLIGSAVLFLLFSVACAFAQNLGQMIVLRALQGFCGGVLIPLSFTLIATLLPPSRQPIGMAMFSLAATLAPAIGPTLGGAISESWGWQSIFYLNLVPGVVMLATLWLSLEREPMQLDLLRRCDWAGIVTVMIGLGAAQTVLEEGEKLDWLDSLFIARLSIVAALSLGLFVWAELTTAHPLVNLRLLGRRNFLGGALAVFLLGLASYGFVFILPTYLAQVQGYNPRQIGLVMAWTGLPQLLVIPLVPPLMRMVDSRWLIAVGLGLLAASNFMNVAMSTDLAGDQLVLPNIVRAVGQALVVTPLVTLSMAGIEASDKASASALINVLRNLGGAFGISLMLSFLIRREHFHSSTIAQSVSLFDEPTRQRIDQLVRYFQSHGVVDPATAWHKAVAAIAGSVHRQAFTLAFGDVFLVLGVILLLAILASLLLKKPVRAAAR
jgi:DHA2 family multidrug resistance protein